LKLLVEHPQTNKLVHIRETKSNKIQLFKLRIYSFTFKLTNRVELHIAQVRVIYLTNLTFNSSAARLVQEPSSTS